MADKKQVRVYDFALPIEYSGWQLWMGLKTLKETKWWPKLSRQIRDRAEQASATWGGKFVITQEDLDSVDDNTWIEMANRFDLPWHMEEVG